MNQCTFEKETTNEDGSFERVICINQASITNPRHPHYGLCYSCAYEKLATERDRLKEALEQIETEGAGGHYSYLAAQALNPKGAE